MHNEQKHNAPPPPKQLLKGKVFINGSIETLTGLHIGGSKTALEIGGVDLNIIKTPLGVPFIPGSSLKGKMRSLLARQEGSTNVKGDTEAIKQLFGDPSIPGNTRLLVRDAHLDKARFEGDFAHAVMEFGYSDVKWENSIKRDTGTANDPRQLERVPAGASFTFGIVLDVYEVNGKTTLKQDLEALYLAMRLLQDDYLGGQGSRGYGQIVFKNTAVKYRSLEKGQYTEQSLGNNTDIASFAQQVSQLHEHAIHTA